MPKKATKSQTKIIEYRKNQRTWIYEAVDPQTGRTFYVGRTIDVLRRGAEHDRKSSSCKQLREYLRLNDFKFHDVVRIVPELSNGVPSSRAAEFEAFFIIQRKTLYDPETRPDGCNLRHGDNVTALDYQAIKEEIEDGFEWEFDDEVPDNVLHAKANEAVLQACVDDLGDEAARLDPELCTALTAATMIRKQVERLHMSPVLLSEILAEEYEDMCSFKEIDRSVFEVDINSLRDRLNAEAVPDEKMLALVRAIALFGKSEGAEWEMRAHVAGNAFRMLAGALETCEEVRMPYTDAIKNMKRARNWCADNENKKPSANALKRKNGNGTAEEQSIGQFLNKWKMFKGKNAYKRVNKSECDFLMRHVPWWKDYSTRTLAEKCATMISKVNSMLKDGYAYKDEPDFEGKKKWPCGRHGSETYSVYNKMKNLVYGRYLDNDVSKVLDGVDPVRANWYKSKSASNRPIFLEKLKRRAAEAASRGHSNGMKPRKKKCKLDSAGASSSSMQIEDSDDDDSDDDDSENVDMDSDDEEDEEDESESE